MIDYLAATCRASTASFCVDIVVCLQQNFLGNEAPSRGREYSHSVLVFWPQSFHLHNMLEWKVSDYGLKALASKLKDDGVVPQKILPAGVKITEAWVEAVLENMGDGEQLWGRELSAAITVLALDHEPEDERLAKLLPRIHPVRDAGPELGRAVRLAGERLGWEAALPIVRAVFEQAAATPGKPVPHFSYDDKANSAFQKLRAMEALVKACPPLAPLRAEIYPRLVDAVVNAETLDNDQVLEALQILVELAKAEELLQLLRRVDVVGLPEEQGGALVEVLKALGGRFGYDALKEPLLVAFGLCTSPGLLVRAEAVLAACPPLEDLRPALNGMAVDALVKHAAQLQRQQLVDAVNAVAR
jgi:hypothetical protein